MGDILVVDDETDICRAMKLIFTEMGHNVHMAHTTSTAVEIIEDVLPDIAFIDLRLGNENGMDLLKLARGKVPDMAIVMISAFGTIESAVQAVKIGAYDYICKPFVNDEIELMVNRIIEQKQLINKNKNLEQEIIDTYRLEKLLGESPPIKKLKHLIRKILLSKANVLLTGDTGTGKNLTAHIIHHYGQRRDNPFVTINCGAIPENLLESELFGHLKGSFTGTVGNKTGLFVKADKGTIFLDEISELPLNMQVKLLNVIHTKEVLPVGATEPVKVDVRIIAATNRDLQEAVKEGAFREDLFYRLNVVQIRMPLLRECREDIPGLIYSNVRKFSKEAEKPLLGVSPSVMKILQDYNWPGNVRELENIIERAVLMCEGNVIEPEDLQISGYESMPTDLKSRIALLEKEYIRDVMRRHDNNKEETARFLKINLATLYRKLSTEN